MKALAIITARGGSKRIPGKNTREFCGRPLIAYSIEAALQSGVFDEVMVSTDDAHIAEVAAGFGAAVPFMRSERTSGDFATTADVLQEVIAEYAKRDITFTYGCCIYPTAPFITGARLREAFSRFETSDADTLLPVVRFSYPVQRSMVIRDGLAELAWPEFASTRSQDLEPHYHDAGQFYFFRTQAFLQNGALLTGRIQPMELPEREVQDIDTPEDLAIAEMKYRLLTGREGTASAAAEGGRNDA